MPEIKYELAHVGINGQNPEEAKSIASLFSEIFTGRRSALRPVNAICYSSAP